MPRQFSKKRGKKRIKSFGEDMELAHAFMISEQTQNFQQPLILAVEDNDDNLLLIDYTLQALGCRFIGQAESSTAVLVAKEYQPDLILLDILLPGVNGIDVLNSLKQEPFTCGIPVIAVTALASVEDRERILAAGFDDYISKPYMIEDLEAMIRHHLCGKLKSSRSSC